MTSNDDETEPTFHVERGDELLLLVPQFHPSSLSDDEREVYDGLREAGAGRFTGAIAVNELAESKFGPGEEVTLRETGRRYMVVVSEALDKLDGD